MKTYSYLWRSFVIVRGFFSAVSYDNAVFPWRVCFGLVVQDFSISCRRANAELRALAVLALFVTGTIVRFLHRLGGGIVRQLSFFVTEALIRRNLLERMSNFLAVMLSLTLWRNH